MFQLGWCTNLYSRDDNQWSSAGFSSLDEARASGWDFQCRVNQWCNGKPATVVPRQAPESVSPWMFRFDGSDFEWTYTFPANGGRRSLASPQGDMNAPSGLRRLLAKWKN